MENEQLAVIRNINVGMRDTNYPICWFDVEMLHGDSMLIIPVEQMIEIIKEAEVYKLQDLNGHACVVEKEDGFIRFKRIKS